MAAIAPPQLAFALRADGEKVRVFDVGKHVANMDLREVNTYLRPGGVFSYHRPDGLFDYKRP